jgi:hypothetical protein
VLLLYLSSTIPSTLRNYSFICHRRYTLSTTDSVVKYVIHKENHWLGVNVLYRKRRSLCSDSYTEMNYSVGGKASSSLGSVQKTICLIKGKAVPLQAWSGPEGSRKLRFPDYVTAAQDSGKVVSLMHRPPLPPGNAPGTHFCLRLSRPQGHSAIGRIMSMKNLNDTIWNRTSGLPICSTVP